MKTTLSKLKSSVQAKPHNAFRSYDGSGNNLYHVTWGAANTAMKRLLPASYSDGLEEIRLSVSGKDLPSARLLSTRLFHSGSEEDLDISLLTLHWGQIVAHDMASITKTTQTRPPYTDCCALADDLPIPMRVGEERCLPIKVPRDDPVFSRRRQRCFNFVRSGTRDDGWRWRPVEQVAEVTHCLDASFVYGSGPRLAQELRQLAGGRLGAEWRGGRDLLPPAPDKLERCAVRSAREVCYLSGDDRTNQNPNLAVMQTVFLREHNRVAEELACLNPHWDDERLYQEARRIVIAEHQHITYHEYLPIILGTRASIAMNCSYEEIVNPSTLNSFATAAFRHQHSNIVGTMRLFDKNMRFVEEVRLSDHFENAGKIEHGCIFDELIRGMTTQGQKRSDGKFTPDIRQNLFRNGSLGQDLLAIDIHRGRDHGLPPYNDFRQLCGLPRATEFADFTDTIPSKSVDGLAREYEHPDDVDLMVGGMLETPVPGATAGPTFVCIMVEQFSRSRAGDRYFYDNPHQIYPFTECQLAEIKKASVSRLLCDNSDSIEKMQPGGFYRKSFVNKPVPCCRLPAVDLSKWKEHDESDFPIA
ncbi:peroxidase-like isoform X2 [Bacillus rossius redtenbacheri]|uniref:peroxidase-like isoform X2 n=1 Tax=Bacillus rossius redtenbacheri TaxID=93214 RepID=UPI002FDD0535